MQTNPTPYKGRNLREPWYRDDRLVWGAVLGVLAGGIGYAALRTAQGRNSVSQRSPDSAPGRTARRNRFGRYAVVGRTVTIAKPRSEVYAFFRDRSNLARFMQNVRSVKGAGDLDHWTIEGPAGSEIHLETRMVEERPGEMISWQSTDVSDIETQGKVLLRDAPGDRGTEVEAIIAYVPPMGTLGRWVAKTFQAEPHMQGRRELKRLKMLMETGEIATSALRNSPS